MTSLDTVEKWDFLRRRGWESVNTLPKDNLFSQIVGWVKLPSMYMYSTDKAYEEETKCQAQE